MFRNVLSSRWECSCRRHYLWKERKPSIKDEKTRARPQAGEATETLQLPYRGALLLSDWTQAKRLNQFIHSFQRRVEISGRLTMVVEDIISLAQSQKGLVGSSIRNWESCGSFGFLSCSVRWEPYREKRTWTSWKPLTRQSHVIEQSLSGIFLCLSG